VEYTPTEELEDPLATRELTTAYSPQYSTFIDFIDMPAALLHGNSLSVGTGDRSFDAQGRLRFCQPRMSIR